MRSSTILRLFAGTFCGMLFLLPSLATATTADELKAQIDAHNQQIAALELEIAKYQTQLNSVSSQKQTLQSTLTALDLSRKKINASVSVAQNQISNTELQIKELGGNIQDKQVSIANGEGGLAESIRALNQTDSLTFAMLVLNSDSLTEFWNDASTLTQFGSQLQDQIQTLKATKTDLETAKAATEKKKAELVVHKNELVAQQRALDVNRRQQADLLAQTKNQESNYQKLIAAKQAAKAQFAKELSNYESQLKYTLDPSSIPQTGKGVLAWPLTTVILTQNFGSTAFSRAGAYNGSGHNGIDLGASIGTPLLAALSGTIEGTGNTDQYKGCYSYGKWVLIRHNNGLSTIYGHMSEIDVSVGQQVSTGQLIGYTGFTGYATGPHLHFGVYVSDAVKIIKLGSIKSDTRCPLASIPVAPFNAYLNPLDYLPPVSKR